MSTHKTLLTILLVWTGCQSETNFTVIVRNADPELLDSVVVFVTANSYQLGKIQPRDSATIKVFPKGDSHVEIEAISMKNGKRRMIVGTYFETGYSGYIRTTINADSIVNVQQSINASKY
jgi:hypothetical protein